LKQTKLVTKNKLEQIKIFLSPK